MENKRDYVGAIFLIFLGTIFLLNTTGVLTWNIWLYILNFWPIFLILGGLRLILGKSKISTIIISILAFLIFAWIGISAYITNNNVTETFFNHFPLINYSNNSAETLNNKFTVENDEEIKSLDYNFDFGVIDFDISDGNDNFLYLDAYYSNNYGKPEIVENQNNDNLNISIKETQSRTFPFVNFITPRYDISLGSELPTDIAINNGVGNGNLELSTQKINNLTVDTGTGSIDLSLSSDSIPTGTLDLNIGTGNIKLTLPSNVGYIINYNLGVGEINLNNRRISGIGSDKSEVRSDNYDDAEKVLTINADIGVGKLNINFNN